MIRKMVKRLALRQTSSEHCKILYLHICTALSIAHMVPVDSINVRNYSGRPLTNSHHFCIMRYEKKCDQGELDYG